MVLRIFKMIATSSFVTALYRTKFVFGRVRGPYSAPPDLLAGLKGLLLRGGGGEGEGKRQGKGKIRGDEGRGWEVPPPFANSCIRPCKVSVICTAHQNSLMCWVR